jgi:hypothetical protein
LAVLDLRALRRAPEQNLDTLAAQWDSFDRAAQGTRKWADGDRTFHIPGARMCLEFLRGRQWSLADIQARAAEGRPIITLNRIKPIVQACKGYYRSNRYELRYMPGVDGTGQPEISTILTKLSKATDEVNKSKWVDANVFDDGIGSGRGFWDIRLDFTRNVMGEIAERRINPFMVHLDPEADEYDPDTWNEVTVEHWLTYDDLVATYGMKLASMIKPLESINARATGLSITNAGEDVTDIQPPTYFGQYASLMDGANEIRLSQGPALVFSDHWNATRRMFRVLDRQHYRRVKSTRMIDRASGAFRILPYDWKEEDIRMAVQQMEARGVEVMIDQAVSRRVRWTVSCLDVLLYDEWSPYSTFTTIPFFPAFEGGATRGLIHDLIDPQREVNAKRSAEMHFLATAANPGWQWPEGSLSDDQKTNMRLNGAKPGFKLEYRVVSGASPARIQPSTPPLAWSRAEEKASNDIEDLAGFNKSAMGQLDRVQSGRAIEARQRAAIAGLEPYFDAMALSKELVGRKRLELYQNFYTEERIVTLTIKDQKVPEKIVINQQNAVGEIVNGISEGTFSANVDLVPISKSYEDGVLQEALELKKLDPAAISSRRIIQLSGLPGKEEILEEIDEAAKNAPPPPEMLKLELEKQGLALKGQELEAKAAEQQQAHELAMETLRLKEYEITGKLAQGDRKIEADGTSKAADRATQIRMHDDKIELEEAKLALGTVSQTAKIAGTETQAAADRAAAIDQMKLSQQHEMRRDVLSGIRARRDKRLDQQHQATEGDKNRATKGEAEKMKASTALKTTLATVSAAREAAKAKAKQNAPTSKSVN